MNGATCTDAVSSYTCACVAGYTGTHCATGESLGLSNLKSVTYIQYIQEMLSVIPEDRSKDAWIAATRKQEWEASRPVRVHRHLSDQGECVNVEFWIDWHTMKHSVGLHVLYRKYATIRCSHGKQYTKSQYMRMCSKDNRA